ncbi:LuxR C-terminal-related transcriptional regulator [Streptomyces caniscabiei]|uniref:helix-turn-helix transcriptional regulator n=1 Tax=Streptomyces caniscabiei TaxID=2746961 RepID=UPI001CE1262F|nr:helix-turn-helix transcriptional regulator [Streptomyces caniscabiei]MDX3512516.1 LuxR C-terminal-related transcriptional regulator [Streptomyces caniscabiei]MDX3721677.1 LuxR C-terminal-related transcriptional regulator [Streptomyces caniscabiei]WEO28550.1 LuxR C-terminal-related transcriptional regulator [Streptomyces caniscabiei]
MGVVTPVNPPQLPHRSPPPPTNAWPSPNAASAGVPTLSEGVRVRLLHAAHGDPRAAAELAAALTRRQLTGLDPLPAEPLALAPALLRTYRREVRALPDDTRFLLLLAAADQYPVQTHAYARAVTAAGLDTRCLDTAEAAGLAHTTAQGIVFRDAWTRVAVYESASMADRREAHRLLAAVLSGEGERPGRSWHRAAAALGPSRRLAAELRLAARVARAIGDPALASALAERAAGLTPEPAERAPLLAQAAAEAWQSGDGDRARRLVAATDDDALGGLLALRAGNAAEAFDALLTATVRHVGDPTSDRAAHLLARATEAAIYTGDLRRCREAAAVADALGILPPSTLGALAAAFEGRYDDARDVLEAAAGRCGPGGDPTQLIHSGIAALLLGDHTRAFTATARAAASARARGETVTVPQAMEFRAYAEFWTGRPKAAEAAALDALRQAHATGQDNGACHLQAALAMFAAVTGDEQVCRERAESARAYALERGLGLPAALAMFALAFLDLSTGRYAASAARLRALAGFGPGHGHRAVRHLATPHYVEAAVRTGDTRVAVAAHADYDRWARTVRSADDLALSARCRALLATGEEAVEHYRAALDLHASGTRDFERARTELLFGSALRRLRNRTEARDRLHSALEAFDHFGSPHCASQARAELRALGERAAAAPGAEALASRLTAQQLMIARMAAEGSTNREIAARLLLSPRTIDHHLRGVFSRLGIRSRIELVRLLGEQSAP